MQITIREAKKDDLPGVLKVYGQPDMDAGSLLTLEEAEKIYSAFQQYPSYRLYVAVDGEKIVGTFALLIMHNLAHLGKKSAVVEDVGVLPEFQGHGVGKLMMQFAMEEAKAHRCYKLVLSSNAKRERAHQFYDSLGFDRHGYSFRVDFSGNDQ
ncbi:MAG TPA: GNAT family N-acetyltransferase [Candidatus Angelobacter sp.]|jgi:GNAT superfamily N-acetyltransferase|nr:GNAT family N-acetyltransferase [Candidatus Angelobacter sp.]